MTSMTPPSADDMASPLAEWTPASLVEHLFTEMSGPRGQRIVKRHAVHQRAIPRANRSHAPPMSSTHCLRS